MSEKLETKLYQAVFGPYKNNKGRLFVVCQTKDGNKKTISYARLLMEEHLGRFLDPELETVDHINGDKNDDRVDNYRLVDRSSHSTMDTRRVKLVELTCDRCGTKFMRSPRLIRIQAKIGTRGQFCSRRCAGAHGRNLALNRIKKLKRVKPVASTYYSLSDHKF